jgi:tryptophan synthase beta chain
MGQRAGNGLQLFGVDLAVYMIKVSSHQKPYRRIVIESFGGQIYPSLSDHTHIGQMALAAGPNSLGSLGPEISEALEFAATSGDAGKVSRSSVLGHAPIHQTVVGHEALEQMEMTGENPDFVIGCASSGSGFAYPLLHQNFTNGKNVVKPFHFAMFVICCAG